MKKLLINIFSFSLIIIMLSYNIFGATFASKLYNISVTFPDYFSVFEAHPEQLGPDKRTLLAMATYSNLGGDNPEVSASNSSGVTSEETSSRLSGNFYLTYSKDALSNELWDSNSLTNEQIDELFSDLMSALSVTLDNVYEKEHIYLGGKYFFYLDCLYTDENNIPHRALAQETILNGAYYNLVFISDTTSAFSKNQIAVIKSVSESIVPITTDPTLSTSSTSLSKSIEPDNLYIVFIIILLSVAIITLGLFFLLNHLSKRKINNAINSNDENIQDNGNKHE